MSHVPSRLLAGGFVFLLHGKQKFIDKPQNCPVS